MSVSIIIPLLIGWLAGLLINYLCDVLPETLKLSPPTCPNLECKQKYSWSDYLLLRACRNCNRKRSARTYAVQAVTLAAAVYIWLVPPVKLGFVFGFPLLVYLLIVAIIDLEHRLILGPLSLTGLVIGGVAGLLVRGIIPTVIGGLAGFGIMYLLYLFGKAFTRMRARRLGTPDDEEALGSGDVTLATIIGLIIGWPLIWFGLILGALFAGVISLIILVVSILRRRYKKQALNMFIAYGPFFIAATILMIYFPKLIAAILPTP
jgi:leader peptidase (prepilin peptidase) / N-methyltransferase